MKYCLTERLDQYTTLEIRTNLPSVFEAVAKDLLLGDSYIKAAMDLIAAQEASEGVERKWLALKHTPDMDTVSLGVIIASSDREAIEQAENTWLPYMRDDQYIEVIEIATL